MKAYKVDNARIPVPLVSGTKSKPWVYVGKNVISIKDKTTAQTEKNLQELATFSFIKKVMIENRKTKMKMKVYMTTM
ncbi:MAG: hypothetical protein ACK4FA_02665 [Candidatus Paceibacteria bacterium]